MRKLFSLLAPISVLIILLSTTPKQDYNARINTAEVKNYRGVYVFYDCMPVQPYEKLGEVKKTISWSGTYSEIRDALVKRAKDDYPKANAIIIYPSNGLNADIAEAISIQN